MKASRFMDAPIPKWMPRHEACHIIGPSAHVKPAAWGRHACAHGFAFVLDAGAVNQQVQRPRH